MPHNQSAALPIAYVALRFLILLNWLWGAIIFGMLAATVVAEEWTMTALGITPSDPIRPILMGLRAIAVLGLIAIPLNDAILRRLVGIVVTVREGDPFVAANAYRLQAIAWALLGLQLISLVIGAIGKALSTPSFPLHLDAGFSPAGWLGMLLTFILARIFAHGTVMREDLEGTV